MTRMRDWRRSNTTAESDTNLTKERNSEPGEGAEGGRREKNKGGGERGKKDNRPVARWKKILARACVNHKPKALPEVVPARRNDHPMLDDD